MKLLVLESATDYCSVAIADGDRLLATLKATEPHRHASLLTVYVQDALKRARLKAADLDVLALGHGPGSYTGLRVGAAVAKGLCLALPGLKFLTVDSMTAMARAMIRELGEDLAPQALLFPTVNSRRGEVYTQCFNARGVAKGPIHSAILAEDPFPEAATAPSYFCGSGLEKIKETLGDRDNFRYLEDLTADAAMLLPLAQAGITAGQFSDYAAYEPLYLKPPFVTKSTKKLL